MFEVTLLLDTIIKYNIIKVSYGNFVIEISQRGKYQ